VRKAPGSALNLTAITTLPGRLWQERPQVSRPLWLFLDEVTLATVSKWLDRPARRQAPDYHRGYAEILARRRLPS
jgi:hypothetical protein